MQVSGDVAPREMRASGKQPIWQKWEGGLALLEDRLALLTGLLVVAMVSAILFDVCSRALTNQSAGWGFDLSEMLMFPLTCAAIGYIARKDKHVSVDLVTLKFGPRGRQRLKVLATLLSLCFAVILLTQGWNAWETARELGII